MSVDLIVHAGTKFALEQWLAARSLGTQTQDTDPESPTFGQWFYRHTYPGSTFYYWNHPSGVLPATWDDTDPENIVTTNFTGFYARLSFLDFGSMPSTLKDWVANNTATSILESFNGVGGEGVTIVNPEDVYNHIDTIGAPKWGGLVGVGNQWSDPELWAFSNVMIGSQRTFDGTVYESTIDFNVWTPTQYPAGWTTTLTPGEWAVSTVYAVDDEVNYLGTTYVCIQAHTSQVGWEPPNAPALWSVV